MFLKHLSIIFIICIVIIQCIPPELSISLELVKSGNSIGIPLSIGTPPQSFQCYLSTVLPKLYLPQYYPSGSSFMVSKIYEPNSSTTFIPLNNAQINLITEVSSSTFGYTASDTLSLLDDQLHVDNFSFITLTEGNQMNTKFICSIGLEYSFTTKDDAKYSLLENLVNSGLIYRRIFYINKQSKTSSTIVFGQTPINYNRLSHRKQYKKCKLIKSPTQPHLWQCNLNAIYFTSDSQIIPINEPLTWSFGGSINCVNAEVYETIKTLFFTSAIDEHICEEKYETGQTYLECIYSYSLTRTYREISIVYIIGKWNIRLNLDDLFHVVNDYTKWFGLIKCDKNITGVGFTWSFGLSHIKKGVFIFDKDNNEFGLSE